MQLSLSPYGSPGSRGDVDPTVGPAVQLRALQARGVEMPMCAPPDFAEQLTCVGVPLAPPAPVGQLVRPPVTRVTGATPPQLVGEGRDALDVLVTTGVLPDGAWQ